MPLNCYPNVMRKLRKPSSITIATAELLVERLASQLQVPCVSDDLRRRLAEEFADWCRAQCARALHAERRVTDDLRRQLELEERRSHALAEELDRRRACET